MKTLIILIGLISAHSFAADWKVETKKGKSFLTKGSEKYAITADVGTPSFVKEEKLNKTFKAVIYHAGDVGTSTLVSIERALLFKNGKFMGVVPYKYTSKKTDEKLGPTWKVSENKLSIEDKSTGEAWEY